MIIDSRKQMKPRKTTQTKKRLEDRNLRNLADKGLKEKGSQRVGWGSTITEVGGAQYSSLPTASQITYPPTITTIEHSSIDIQPLYLLPNA